MAILVKNATIFDFVGFDPFAEWKSPSASFDGEVGNVTNGPVTTSPLLNDAAFLE